MPHPNNVMKIVLLTAVVHIGYSFQWSLKPVEPECLDDQHPFHYHLMSDAEFKGNICCKRPVNVTQDLGKDLNLICCATTGTQCEEIDDPVISKIKCCRGLFAKKKKNGEKVYIDEKNCQKDDKIAKCRGPDSGQWNLTGTLMPTFKEKFRLGALIEHRCCTYHHRPYLFARYSKSATSLSAESVTLLTCCESPIIAYRDREMIFNDCCVVHLYKNNTVTTNNFLNVQLCPENKSRMRCCGTADTSYCDSPSGMCVQDSGLATGCANVSRVIRRREAAGDFVHDFNDLS